MNIRSENQMRLVIVGATGMVGSYALRYMLDHPAVGRAMAIGRRKLGISHPKLNEVLHQDFSDCTALAEAISGQDACVFCMGTYTGKVPDAELRTITVDYAIEFARVLRRSSPDAAFAFLNSRRAVAQLHRLRGTQAGRFEFHNVFRSRSAESIDEDMRPRRRSGSGRNAGDGWDEGTSHAISDSWLVVRRGH